MKYLSLIVAAALVLTSSSDAAALFYSNSVGGSKPIPNSYIVMLKNDSSISTFQPKFNSIVNRIVNVRERGNIKINHHFSSIPGFIADLDSSSLKEILNMPEVDYVDQDIRFTNLDDQVPPAPPSASQTNPPSWGLPRVSRRKALGNTTVPYLYPKSAGAGVTVYIIDSGIYFNHTDFQGRAKNGKNFIKGEPDHDERGHGTHVAGTIGGKKYGIAKKVNLVSVKVSDKDGAVSLKDMLSGLDWVIQNGKGKKAIASMSMSAERTKSLDDAVKRVYNANIPIIVSAGNEGNGHSACERSPAGSKHAFTVAAMGRKDNVSSRSSLGECVNIFAPGEDIRSATFQWNEKKQSVVYGGGLKSGTSMAVPHVSGVAALYMSEDKSLKTPDQIYKKLKSTALKNVIKGNVRKAPNLLVFNGVGK